MESFLFVSYGLTKSGSTLAFELARTALERAGCPQPQLPVPGLVVSRKINAIEHVTEDQAAAAMAAIRSLGHPVAVKTHTRPDPALAALVRRGDARVHTVVRDPRDMALSMLDNGRRSRADGRPAFSEIVTLDDALAGLENQMDTLAAWLALPGVQVLRYDDLAFDTVSAAAQIIAQLGIPGDAEAVAEEVLRNRFIQFNKGVRDRHAAEMDAVQSVRIRARFAPFYDLVLSRKAPGKALDPGTRLTSAVDKTRVSP